MRSIPFKIIAVLGLNDGEFPRQRQPLGFDLMAQTASQLGDRSRRGDDRYLFLEAIISARHALYLSYQGRNIKNNNETQPSLVLKELMDYLTNGYGWSFNETKASDINTSQLYQVPMQPFSEDNYVDDQSSSKPSFDANWLKLAQNKESTSKQSTLVVDDEDITQTTLTIDELVRFYQHPSKVFAQKKLNLYLDNYDVQLDDVEPFSADYLESYLLKQALLKASLHASNNEDVMANNLNPTTEQVLLSAKLSGKFPDLPSTQEHFDVWLEDTKQFSDAIISQGCANPEELDCHVQLNITQDKPITVAAKLPIIQTSQGVQLVFYRSSSAKAKDLFTLFLHQLIVQVWQQQNSNIENYHDNRLSQIQGTCGFYFNAKANKVEEYNLMSIDNATDKLIQLMEVFELGHKQALLLNGELAAQVFKQSRGKVVEFTQERFEQFWIGSGTQGKDSIPGFGEDAYIRYFWQILPSIESFIPQLMTIYEDVYQSIQKVSTKTKEERS
jgi:exodeoxyribonuclease V gamma subunit